MHILTVIDHPDPNSFSHAIAARFGDGAVAAGHSVEVADLHAEGFDPRWTLADIEHGREGPVPQDLAIEQARIARADALALVFPLFWWGMPAMLKGWIDRVWTYDWAYTFEDGGRPLQPERRCVLLVPAGTSPQAMAPHGYPGAMDRIWTTGTLAYFGMPDADLVLLHGANGSDARRAALLETAYRVGIEFSGPKG